MTNEEGWLAGEILSLLLCHYGKSQDVFMRILTDAKEQGKDMPVIANLLREIISDNRNKKVYLQEIDLCEAVVK